MTKDDAIQLLKSKRPVCCFWQPTWGGQEQSGYVSSVEDFMTRE
jgi:hypothetical protein